MYPDRELKDWDCITFDYILAQFYLRLDEIIKGGYVDLGHFEKVCSHKYDIDRKEGENYYHWDFVDLKKAIDALPESYARKNQLQELLAVAISARDRYEGQYNKSVENV